MSLAGLVCVAASGDAHAGLMGQAVGYWGFAEGSGTTTADLSTTSPNIPLTLAGTAQGSCKNVLDPINSGLPYKFNDGAFGSQHPGGAQFALCDGSVTFVSETIGHAVFLATASRNGGEMYSLP
jgi:prepilin-type processing-associated H-X9-DG protein